MTITTNTFNNVSLITPVGQLLYVFVAASDRDHHEFWDITGFAPIDYRHNYEHYYYPRINNFTSFPSQIKSGKNLVITLNGSDATKSFVNGVDVIAFTTIAQSDKNAKTVNIAEIDVKDFFATGKIDTIDSLKAEKIDAVDITESEKIYIDVVDISKTKKIDNIDYLKTEKIDAADIAKTEKIDAVNSLKTEKNNIADITKIEKTEKIDVTADITKTGGIDLADSSTTKKIDINNVDITDITKTEKIDVDVANSLETKKIDITDIAKTEKIDVVNIPTTEKITEIKLGLDGFIAKIDDNDDGIINDGKFKINKNVNPNSPLLEKRSQFVNLDNFFGSDYFYNAIGINKTTLLNSIQTLENNQKGTNKNVRMLGDAFVEYELISKQLASLRKDALYLSNSDSSALANNANSEIKLLLDNAKTEINRMGLDEDDIANIALNGLSQSQINNLQKDIILFTAQTINGELILSPTLYLTENNKKALTGYSSTTASFNINDAQLSSGGLFAANNITIDANGADIINNNNIIANGNVTITADNLTNRTNNIINAKIEAGSNGGIIDSDGNNLLGNLTITTINDIKNIGATIKANNVLNLEASGNIINSAVIFTNDNNLLKQNTNLVGENSDNADNPYQLGLGQTQNNSNSGYFVSVLGNEAEIAGGSVIISAGEDFVNLAANISATQNELVDGENSSGNVEIVAGDDINVEALALRNRSETSWGTRKKGGLTVLDNTINIGSNITAAGSIVLATTAEGVDAEGLKIVELNNQRISQIETIEEKLLHLQTKKLSLQNKLQPQNLNPQGRYSKKQHQVNIIESEISSLKNQIQEANKNFNEAASPLISGLGSNINITGSKISAQGDVNINAQNNINIVNAVDSSYHHSESHKKGSTRTTNSVQTDYVETAAKSELNGNNINLSAGSDILIQASNINIDNNLTIGRLALVDDGAGGYVKNDDGSFATVSSETVNNLTIQNATLNESHFAHSSRQYNGTAKIGAHITSTVIGTTDLVFNLLNNVIKPITKELDDHAQKDAQEFSNKRLPDSISQKVNNKIVNNIDADYFGDKKNEFKNNSLYNIKQKTFETTQQTNIAESNLNIGNNIDIKTGENVIIQASNINAGTADTTIDKSNNAIAGEVAIQADNLYIATASETELNSFEDKKTRTLSFNNFNSGSLSTNDINTEISAKNNNYNFDIANEITLSYNHNDYNKDINEINNDNPNNQTRLAYLQYIRNNNDADFGGTNLVNYTETANTNLEWHDNVRGLTDAGTAVIAVAAVAATIATAGATGFAVAGTAAAASATTLAVGATTVGVAVASSAATTAAVSATNTSMNAEGDMFKQTKDISKQTAKDTTSKESLENMATAGATAAITFGLTQGVSELTNSANAANTTNQTANAASSATQLPAINSNLTTLNLDGFPATSLASSGINNSTTLTSRFLTALQNSSIQTISSSAAQSAVKEDSLSEALKNSTQNLLINAAGEVIANNIGTS